MFYSITPRLHRDVQRSWYCRTEIKTEWEATSQSQPTTTAPQLRAAAGSVSRDGSHPSLVYHRFSVLLAVVVMSLFVAGDLLGLFFCDSVSPSRQLSACRFVPRFGCNLVSSRRMSLFIQPRHSHTLPVCAGGEHPRAAQAAVPSIPPVDYFTTRLMLGKPDAAACRRPLPPPQLVANALNRASLSKKPGN
jgi:hypothetical protein